MSHFRVRLGCVAPCFGILEPAMDAAPYPPKFAPCVVRRFLARLLPLEATVAREISFVQAESLSSLL